MTQSACDVVAGIGFRHAASAHEIAELVARALDAAGFDAARLHALATAEDRALDLAFRAAAERFGVPALGLAPGALRAVDARVPTRSSRIEAARGVGSLAEAAALAAAGEEAVLVLPRIAGPVATCALALARRSL